MNIGENIRIARGKRSQQYLAKSLSISPNTLSAYEKNRSIPSLEVFKEICEALDFSADKLLDIKDTTNTPKNEGEMLAHKLSNIRDQLEMTQEKMARLIGVSPGTLSKYETGNRTPPLKRFQTICKECKISADYLLGLNKEMEE